MKRLRFFMIIFFICLSIPLGYFILRTHQSIDQEEIAELRYFADTLFYEMEKELSDLVLKEEGRAIEDYTTASQLSVLPEKNYILGYFQNNPDGSFLTPLAPEISGLPDSRTQATENDAISAAVRRLEDANRIFNTRRADVAEPVEIPRPEKVLPQKEKEITLAGRYLDVSRSKSKKGYLGQEEKRVENITADQAFKLSKQDAALPASASAPTVFQEDRQELLPVRDADASVFRAEIDPMQSVFVSDAQVVFFRRIVIDNQVYRQGFVLLVDPFLNHMVSAHYLYQPMSKFTRLNLSIQNKGKKRTVIETGAVSGNLRFSLDHIFPRPFSFVNARLVSDRIPQSPGRQTLNIMMSVMILVILMGLFAIYRSVHAIVGLSERRSQFVSSVTHELKTPLTNIRMYIEMLEQGIAATPEREQDYFRILGSESRRLSRLINNVLEYSKLEKKNRRMELSEGNFEDVIAEVKSIMSEKIRQEGFALHDEKNAGSPFMYDREVMIQVLINLIENSLKFGKNAAEKNISLRIEPQGREVKISLSDTGPGIPKHALKKVFDDFYRVDNELTRTTGGTGIGLALVYKFVKTMGGRVVAENNSGPGCTISLYLS